MAPRGAVPVGLAGLAVAVVVAVGLAPAAAGDDPPAPATPLPRPPLDPPERRAPQRVARVEPVQLPPLPPEGLTLGDSGPMVRALEDRFVQLHFDPGPVDGRFDQATQFAVWAFEKLWGMRPTGVVDALVWAALAAGREPPPLLQEGGDDRVEIDLVRQLLFVYREGRLVLVSHISSGNGRRFCAPGGCGVAVTPAGTYRFLWRVSGWRTSRLGRLWNPVYFTGSGIAVHGFPSVPAFPASHGCVRVPMHIGNYFPTLVRLGDPVYVFDGTTEVRPLPPTDAEAGPPGPPVGGLDGDPPPPTTTTTLPAILT